MTSRAPRSPLTVVLAGAFPERGDMIRGGVEAVAHALAGELARREGIALHVLALRRDGGRDETRAAAGYTVHLLSPAARLPYSLRVTRADPRRLRRVLDRIRPDVVHGHGIDAPALAGVASGWPTLLCIHGIAHRDVLAEMRRGVGARALWDRVRLREARRLERLVIPRATRVASTAPDYVRAVYGSLLPGPVAPIDNPVADAYFGIPPAGPAETVLFAGFVRPLKGLDILIDAFAQVVRRVPAAALRIAGVAPDPTWRAALERRAVERGVAGRVAFLGGISEAAMVAEYARAAVVCLPSRQENAPLAVQQGMAARRPVVATRVGGVPRLVDHDVTGFLTDPGDVDATAAHLTHLLEDRSLATRMGEAGRRVAEARFRLPRVADRMLALYEETRIACERPGERAGALRQDDEAAPDPGAVH